MIDLHEPRELIPAGDLDIHRALRSLIEELEAIDWYHQRALATGQDALREIVLHNRNEEIEHASMMLEFLRRSMPEWDVRLRRFLFTEGDVTRLEAVVPPQETPGAGDLGLRDLQEDA